MNSSIATVRNSVLLGAFAALTAVLIAGTWHGTREDIARAQREAEARQLLEIFPADSHDNDLLTDRVMLPANTPLLELRAERPAYTARLQQQVIGVILPATARDGYSGDISLLVGVEANGQLAGVRVVNHRETPGLGDAIERSKSDWILAFDGRSLEAPAANDWQVKKDGGVFDQFTGATVTPRAVVIAVRKALEYAELNKAKLFPPATLNPSADAPAQATGEPHALESES